jgi:tol-pal system protein YbgF
VGTLLSLTVTILAAYGLSRPGSVMHRPPLFFVLITFLIGPGIIPSYLLVTSLGLKNNYAALILPVAINAFRQFLEAYPDGPFSDNAQYWLGEAYYVSRDFPNALAEFRKVIERHPDSQKVPDAMLKIGYTQYELRQWDVARRMLTDVSQRAPGTTVARLAQQRLDRMRQEGR